MLPVGRAGGAASSALAADLQEIIKRDKLIAVTSGNLRPVTFHDEKGVAGSYEINVTWCA